MQRIGLPFILVTALVLIGACGSSQERQQAQDQPSTATNVAATWHLGFEDVSEGDLPPGWIVTETNSAGTPATWRVQSRTDAPEGRKVLTLVATENSGSTYNLFLSKKTFPADLKLRVDLHANTGEEDQGGGLVWRAQDHDNYQLVRWNPLEDNLRVYKVVDGHRSQLASVILEADPKTWHVLEVTARGDAITIRFDGKQVLAAEDDTFRRGGRIGFWTKADAATSFDDLTVEGGRH